MTDPTGHDGDLGSLMMSTSIGASLDSMYNGGVTSAGTAMMQTIFGVENRQTAQQILTGYYIDVAVGLGVGVAVGAAASIADTVVNGVEVEVIASSQQGAQAAALNETTEMRIVAAANRAAKTVGKGSGHEDGSKVHAALENEIKAMGDANLSPEVSYKNRVKVSRGTPDSIRVDVAEGPVDAPTVVYDLKTGTAKLKQARIKEIQANLPNGQNVPIIEIRLSQ